jgi:hypothetical protein
VNPVIPAPVPIPLPAPLWLLHVLLVFTFVLHLLAMNLLAGGVGLLAVSGYLGRRQPRHRELTRRVARVMPPVVAFTITLGVAPLLFLQLVYGQLFYTSSVMMAWAWLAVVLLVMIGYYGVYWVAMQEDESQKRGFGVIAVTALLFLVVMMIFVQNMSFLQRPTDFYPRFLQTTVGNYLGSLHARTLLRYAHFLVAALALAGLGLALLARAWRENAPEFATWARSYGTKWFMIGTGVELAVGLGFLFSQPIDIRNLFLGGDQLATAILAVGVVLAVLAIGVAPKSIPLATAAIVGTVGLMAIVRFLLRRAYLNPYFDPRTLPVESQWVVFGLFVLLLVVGLAIVAWMLYHFLRPTTHPTSA